jgi:hypothetical protein
VPQPERAPLGKALPFSEVMVNGPDDEYVEREGPIWQCCVGESQGEGDRYLGRVSDHKGQLGEGVGKPGGGRHVGPEIVETPAEVLNEGMAGDDDPGGTVSLQPSHRPEASLEA